MKNTLFPWHPVNFFSNPARQKESGSETLIVLKHVFFAFETILFKNQVLKIVVFAFYTVLRFCFANVVVAFYTIVLVHIRLQIVIFESNKFFVPVD